MQKIVSNLPFSNEALHYIPKFNRATTDYTFLPTDSLSLNSHSNLNPIPQNGDIFIYFPYSKNECLLSNSLEEKRRVGNFNKIIINTFNEGGIGVKNVYHPEFLKGFVQEVSQRFQAKTVLLTQNQLAENGQDILYSNMAWGDYRFGSSPPIKGQYKFLYLNGYAREEKVRMINALYSRGLLNQSLWSLLDIKDQSCNLDIRLRNQIPKKIPGDIIASRPAGENYPLINFINQMLYKSTDFSLVQESEMQSFTNRYTEKTVKAILQKHPFIIAGNFNTLKTLKHDGFKTFSPYINEEYDGIIDLDNRIDAITREVERLCTMAKSSWSELKERVKEILDYNYDHFFKKNQLHKKTFKDLII
jgi:hypothetical protein